MNLFELFDKSETQDREYYTAKKPLAVILAILGLLAMVLCTPAGATYIESWLTELVPAIATPAAWLIAIGFDLTFAYLLSHLFRDIFSGMNNRKTYWDIPTIILTVLFGGVTLCWSFWGGDMRKATASKTIAAKQGQLIDSTYHAAVSLATSGDKITASGKSITRDQRKNNEAIAQETEAKTKQVQLLSAITEKKLINGQKAEVHQHNIIENGKMIIVGAYLFLLVSIAAIEYIKSQKPTNSKSAKSSTKSEQKKGKSESKSIGFFGNSEGHVLNSTIAYEKEDGTLKYYKAYQLSSMITDATKKENWEQVERLKGLRDILRPPVKQDA
jgi:hypothetical protein